MQEPKLLPSEAYQSSKKSHTARVIADYIAGMTDRYALSEHQRLFNI